MIHLEPVTLHVDPAQRDEIVRAVERYSAPLRLPPRPGRVVRFVAGVLLWIGDMLTVAGHALGRLAERLDPMPRTPLGVLVEPP